MCCCLLSQKCERGVYWVPLAKHSEQLSSLSPRLVHSLMVPRRWRLFFLFVFFTISRSGVSQFVFRSVPIASLRFPDCRNFAPPFVFRSLEEKIKIKIGPIFLVASGVFVVPELWLRFGRLAVQPRWCTPPKLLLRCKSFRGGGKLCVRVELKGVKEKDSNCYLVAIHNWFSVRQRQVHFWSYSRWSEFQEVKPERVFGACFLSVCMLSQVCCRHCFCIYFFCARRCGALCVHACCLCFLFLASVYPFPLFLRFSVRGRRSSRWNKRRNTLIGIFSVLSLFLTVSEIICKLRLCRAGRWRCEIVDIRVASASLEAALGMNRFLSRQLWFFVCLANSSGARVLPDAFLNRRQSPIQKSAHLLRSPNTVLCFCGFLNSFLTYSTYL